MTVIIPVLFMKSNLQIEKLVILIALLNQYYPMCEYIFQIITNIKVFENAKTRLNQLLAYEKDRRGNVILKDIIHVISGTIDFKYSDSEEKLIIRHFYYKYF